MIQICLSKTIIMIEQDRTGLDDKRYWHYIYKEYCFERSQNKCQHCNRYIYLSQGVVHHKTYKHKGGIYNAHPDDIWDKIEVLCHECHRSVHESCSIDGVTKILKRKEYDPWDNYEDEEDIPFCSNCGWVEYNLNSENLCGHCEFEKRVFEKELEEFYWHN